MTEYMLVAFPNGSDGAGATMKSLEKAVASGDSNLAGTYPLHPRRVGLSRRL